MALKIGFRNVTSQHREGEHGIFYSINVAEPIYSNLLSLKHNIHRNHVLISREEHANFKIYLC
jgi:hypothetical protein